MGEIVGAFGVSHAPAMTARPEAAPPEQIAALRAGFAEARDRLAALHPDVVVLIAAEHWANFFLDNFPAFCVGTAERFEGPLEEWLRVDRVEIAGAPALARAIVEDAIDAGIEPAWSERLALDHGCMVPLHFLTPRMNVPVVPVIQNCLQPPMPRAHRCYAFGRAIGQTIERSHERAVIVASGGLSHWPGHAKHGTINIEWDSEVLELITHGRGEALSCYTDAQIDEGGTGAAEIRNWIAMLGAFGPSTAEVLAYQPVTQFATGCAVVQLHR
ncbi:MAG TPA: extradiol ring-cleavage dioxygenase [Chloroflexota bacterium]|nr:extradiol ring-cleavage dioxygenase [Chloroflexota bacterium]